MHSFKATCRASLLVLILQSCSVSRTATLPTLNLTSIPNGLLMPNLTLTYNAGYKPRAPDPYLATQNAETVLFFEFGSTPFADAKLVLVLYQMYNDYQPHMFQSDVLMGKRDRIYTHDEVTLVIYPNAKMTWSMFGNTWLLLGHYQSEYQCVAMEFDITHGESVNVGWGQVRLG